MFSIEECKAHFLPQLMELRTALHETPELGFAEYRTTALLRRFFSREPFEFVSLGTETGLVVRLRGARPGKTVAIRADIDALPVPESSENPIRSQTPGCMHACGHDMHMAYVCGAGLLLETVRAQLAGNVVLVFQPAEEPISGAQRLLDAGLIEKLGIDCMLGSHVKPELPIGTVSIRDGAVMAAKDSFVIDVIGQGGHGATPDACCDPIITSATIISALQSIVSRSNDPHDAGVLSICSIHGGNADNIIPDTVRLTGSMRTTSEAQRALFKRRLREISESTAQAMNCRAIVTDLPGVPVLYNDDRLAAHCRESAGALLGEKNVTALPIETISEDFAWYAQRIPCCYVGIGTAEEGKPYYPLHSSRFFPSEQVLPIGAVLLAGMARDLLIE